MQVNDKTTDLEVLWEGIVGIVDGMIQEKTPEEVEEDTGNAVESSQETLKVIIPNSKEEVVELENKTLRLLEELISMMYFGTDLRDAEMRSDSSFLAKLSTRLHREVLLTLDAPMAVGMRANDSNVYLLINPIRLRFTVTTIGEIIAIVRHELYHILYNHLSESKRYGRDKKTQYVLNIAQDCEINQTALIKGALPEGAVTLDYVREESGCPELEEKAGYVVYYKALMNSPEYQEKLSKLDNEEDKVVTSEGMGQGSFGKGGQQSEGYKNSTTGLEDMVGGNTHETWGGEDVSQDTAEKAISGVVRDTYNTLTDKERGLLSQSVKGQIAKIDHVPDVDWRDKIRRQTGKMKTQNKRKTLSRPNRRYPDRLELKGKLPDYSIRIVMALDVSGSVSDIALSYAMGEGYHLSKELGYPLTLLQIDSELLSEQELKKPSDFSNVSLNGRGGTRFQPAFDYLTKHNYTDKNTMLVYVTDGYGEPEEHITRNGFNNVLWLLVDTADKGYLSCDGKGRVEILDKDKYSN